MESCTHVTCLLLCDNIHSGYLLGRDNYLQIKTVKMSSFFSPAELKEAWLPFLFLSYSNNGLTAQLPR